MSTRALALRRCESEDCEFKWRSECFEADITVTTRLVKACKGLPEVAIFPDQMRFDAKLTGYG